LAADLLKGYIEALDAKYSDLDQNNNVRLAKWLEARLEQAIQYKHASGVQCRIYNAWHAAHNKYTPAQCEAIKQAKAPEVFYGLFSQQRRTFLAWYEELLSQIKWKPFTLSPSPMAELPPDARKEVIDAVLQRLVTGDPSLQVTNVSEALVQEQKVTARLVKAKAASMAERATQVVHDQLIDGGWGETFKEFRSDLATYCNAFILAPEVTSKRQLEWRGTKAVATQKTVMSTRTVSPFSVFPMPDCTSPQDGEGVWIVDEVTHNTLVGIKDSDGSIPEAIDKLIAKNPTGWSVTSWINQSTRPLEGHGSYKDALAILGVTDSVPTYSVAKFYGDLLKSKLEDEEGNMTIELRETDKDSFTVPVEIWMCDGYVIRIIRNNHPEGKRPLFTASYEHSPRSFWGIGLYDILEQTQKNINLAHRNLVKHSRQAMAFFGEIDMARMGRNQIGNELPIDEIIKTDGDYTRGGHRALHFHDLPSKILDALRLIDHYDNEAQTLTGIRKFMSGATDLGVAGRTNGVVNALQTNSTKLIIAVQGEVNDKVIAHLVDYYYKINLAFGKDKSMRADLKVVIRGADGLAEREIENAKFEKVLQYGQQLLLPTPTGQTLIDIRDVQQMVHRYMTANGTDLAYTPRPEEELGSSQGGTLGNGGLPGIDARSIPPDLSGGGGGSIPGR
jgi:hypothetical protein